MPADQSQHAAPKSAETVPPMPSAPSPPPSGGTDTWYVLGPSGVTRSPADDTAAHAATGDEFLTSAHSAPPRKWQALCALLGALVLAGGIASVLFQRAAGSWEDKAHRSESRAAGLSKKLDESRATVATLQSRIDDLASEKADAQDSQALAEGQRDLAAGIAALAAQAADDMQACGSEVGLLFSSVVDAFTLGTGDVTGLMPFAQRADDKCATADASYAAFNDALASL